MFSKEMNTLTLVCIVLLLFSCREDQEKGDSTAEEGQKTEKTDERPEGISDSVAPEEEPSLFETSENCTLFLKKVIRLQRDIMEDPENKAFSDSLLKTTYDTLDRVFYCAGTGVKNKKIPGGMEPVRRTAEITGKRWALYQKAWLHGYKGLEFGDKISGKVMDTSPLCSIVSGDTMFLLLSIPEQSVVIKESNLNNS